jgi:hypothetical protein
MRAFHLGASSLLKSARRQHQIAAQFLRLYDNIKAMDNQRAGQTSRIG